MPDPDVFLLIPTHTTRHLAACLASLAHLEEPPRALVVTCDTDDPTIGELLDGLAPRVNSILASRDENQIPIWHTFRPHQGRAQLNQVRNNGLRALRAHASLTPEDLVVVLDGDTMLASNAIAQHRALLRQGAQFIIPYRFMVGEEATRDLDAESVLSGGVPRSALVTHAMEADLAHRARRYRRHLWMKRFGLGKPHKPKLIGGHHAVRFDRLLEANGFDEEYVGYRFNDDDLSRRLHQLRPRIRTAIAVTQIEAYHLWHPIRAPERLQDAPGYERWSRRDLPPRCERGIERPLEQPEPVVRRVV